MIASLLIPILVSAVALFFASFLSWMVLQFHKKDWVKLSKEDEFIDGMKKLDVPPGNYMYPACDDPKEMQSEEFKKKYSEGPKGVITVFPKGDPMGRNLGLTFVYFLVLSFCLGYLGTLGLARGAEFMTVFRFMGTAAFLVFLSAMVLHSIWFRSRVMGHVLESILYALVVGGIFGWLWPGVVEA